MSAKIKQYFTLNCWKQRSLHVKMRQILEIRKWWAQTHQTKRLLVYLNFPIIDGIWTFSVFLFISICVQNNWFDKLALVYDTHYMDFEVIFRFSSLVLTFTHIQAGNICHSPPKKLVETKSELTDGLCFTLQSPFDQVVSRIKYNIRIYKNKIFNGIK